MADYSEHAGLFCGAEDAGADRFAGKAKDRFHFTYTTAEWDALTTPARKSATA
jgi:hypothetical protein